MLIYNYQKKFLGISEFDLNSLGFSDLSELKRVSPDFADLFVKTPGHVHNFKHIHWIDFVNYAEGSEDSRVIINAKGKNFKAILDVKTAYLADNPSKKAFFVNLMSLKPLTQKENDQISNDILEQRLQGETVAPNTHTLVQKKNGKEALQEVIDDPYEPDAIKTQDFYNDKTVDLDEVIDDPYETDAIETQDFYDDKPIDLDEALQEAIDDPYEPDSIETQDFYDDKPIDLDEALQEAIDDPYETDAIETQDFYDDKPIDLDEALQEAIDDPYEPDALKMQDFHNDKPIDLNNDFYDDIDEKLENDLNDDLSKIYEEKITSNDAAKELLEDTKPSNINESYLEEKVSPKEIKLPDIDENYLYDPQLASTELGLPVDLIEEFIQDFIEQAIDFKNNLYFSLQNSNIENVKALSHKLKGVAANLRIEDAFKVLSVINTSDDIDEIKINLDGFYHVISKLSSNGVKTPLPETPNNIDIKDSNNVETSLLDVEKSTNIKDSDKDAQDDDLTLSSKDDIEDIKTTPTFDNKSTDEEDLMIEGLEKINFDDMNTLNLELSKSQKTNKEPIINKSLTADKIGISQENFDLLFKDYILEGYKICKQIDESILNNLPQKWVQSATKFKRMSDNMHINYFDQELEEILNTKEAQIVREKLKSLNTKLHDISMVED